MKRPTTRYLLAFSALLGGCLDEFPTFGADVQPVGPLRDAMTDDARPRVDARLAVDGGPDAG
ncbi:MAG: hypothetical protein KC549_10725, partial [Myxococcales bacterium]|nr:hypothetical protein [Myxococcales bacterium]